MGLSCTCDFWDREPGSWQYYHQEDFVKLETARRKRCCSCKELIELGADCLEFPRERAPYNEIEERIKGDEIPISPWHMCEKCGEIYLNLQAAGYCLWIGDDMRDLLKEYQEMTGFKPQI